MKKVMISNELIMALFRYHLADIPTEEAYIKSELEKKMQAMIRHENYTEYKTADLPEKSEEARQKYLDSIGVSESFRW